MSLKDVQKKLIAKQYDPGPADGIYGVKTETAILEAIASAPVKPKPQPIPVPPGSNPYSIKDHLLYKHGQQVDSKLSPNHGGEIDPTLIVIHYTASTGLISTIDWLCTPQGPKSVSAHLVIAKTGVVWQLVPFNISAWHAGISSWKGREYCNSFSIGIENMGFGDEWPDAQIEANRLIIAALKTEYDIDDVVGHSDVAPGRKVDPGPNYPWVKVL